MNTLEEQAISCPYCGESIDILVDFSFGEESYVEPESVRSLRHEPQAIDSTAV